MSDWQLLTGWKVDHFKLSFKLHSAIFRAGMGPFSDPVSLKVSGHDLSPFQHSVVAPELPLPNMTNVLQQTWFVSTVGILALLLVLTAVGFVYVKRKYATEKNFDHYDGERHKIFKTKIFQIWLTLENMTKTVTFS